MNKLKYIASEKLDHIQTEQEIRIVGKISDWTAEGVYDATQMNSTPTSQEITEYLDGIRAGGSEFVRPKSPLGSILRDCSIGFCPNCGSTEDRRFWLFGKRKCINPECELSRGWRKA